MPAFARRHFGPRGTLRLHREAVGFDLLRAPLNVLLVAPAFFVRLASLLLRLAGLRRTARWLADRRLFVETRLSRRIAALIATELLRLDPAREAAAEPCIAEYVAARAAVADLAAGLMALVASAATLHVLAPSAISLGPLLAQEYAERQAAAGFWLGEAAGRVYHGLWPARAGWGETAAFTLLLLALFALASTFMGVVTDPLQRRLGLHDLRLLRLIRTLERLDAGDAEARLALPDPYVARLADLVDLAAIGLRHLR